MPQRYAARVGAHPRRRSGACTGGTDADRGGGARAVQADGLQGRVRGRAALHRDRFPASASPTSSRATTSCTFIWRRRCSPSATRRPGICKSALTGRGCSARSACWRSCAGCAARAFDIFGRTAERRTERRLIAEYEAVLDEIANGLTPQNHAVAVELAALPLEIRGFGHVKEANLRARQGEGSRSPRPLPRAAAARDGGGISGAAATHSRQDGRQERPER